MNWTNNKRWLFTENENNNEASIFINQVSNVSIQNRPRRTYVFKLFWWFHYRCIYSLSVCNRSSVDHQFDFFPPKNSIFRWQLKLMLKANYSKTEAKKAPRKISILSKHFISTTVPATISLRSQKQHNCSFSTAWKGQFIINYKQWAEHRNGEANWV